MVLNLITPLSLLFLFFMNLSSKMASVLAVSSSKRLHIIRHGQAMHNPRAEVAKANGCSMEEFVDLMRQDDALDAELTTVGRQQAQEAANLVVSSISATTSTDYLVVSSPLSRALETADLVLSPEQAPRRVSCELFREVNGNMLCAQRRTRTELVQKFAHWNFDQLQQDHDHLWTPEMESFEDSAERGYQGLRWLMDRPEDDIVVVSHGGILRYTMNIHPLVSLQDERNNKGSTSTSTSPSTSSTVDILLKPVEARFENCEVRRYVLSWKEEEDESKESCANNEKGEDGRRPIVLTQIDR
jgi:broad specificity phosphatase PhoE